MNPRRSILAGTAAGALLVVLSACGSSSAPPGSAPDAGGPAISATPTAQVTTQPAAGAKIINITVTSSSLSPNGAEAKVNRNQPVVLEINATQAGQLHVHSSPEQHIDFPKGDSQITLSFDKPGLIAIEDHAMKSELIVQLEVS